MSISLAHDLTANIVISVDVIVMYVAKTQRVAELQQLAVTQDLKKLLKDTQWTETMSACGMSKT